MAKQCENSVEGRNGGTLRPFKPGQSGNPSGRPKERPIAAAIKDLLDKDDGKATRALAEVGLKKALKGDFRFFKELAERIDGKVLGEFDVTSGGEAIQSGDAAYAAALVEKLRQDEGAE